MDRQPPVPPPSLSPVLPSPPPPGKHSRAMLSRLARTRGSRDARYVVLDPQAPIPIRFPSYPPRRRLAPLFTRISCAYFLRNTEKKPKRNGYPCLLCIDMVRLFGKPARLARVKFGRSIKDGKRARDRVEESNGEEDIGAERSIARAFPACEYRVYAITRSLIKTFGDTRTPGVGTRVFNWLRASVTPERNSRNKSTTTARMTMTCNVTRRRRSRIVLEFSRAAAAALPRQPPPSPSS